MKKGFTLVELLAVIVILALLAVIAVPSAFGISESIKEKMYCEKISMILSSAKTWGNEHSSRLKSNCYLETSIKALIDEGVIKKENDNAPYITNPVTGESMDEKKVFLYLKNKRAYAFYDFNSESLEKLRTVCEIEVPDTRPTTKCN